MRSKDIDSRGAFSREDRRFLSREQIEPKMRDSYKRETIIDYTSTDYAASDYCKFSPRFFGDSPGFESSRTQRELARETGAMGIERGG